MPKIGLGVYVPDEVVNGITMLGGFVLLPPATVDAFSTTSGIRIIAAQLPALFGKLDIYRCYALSRNLVEVAHNTHRMRVDAAFGISTEILLTTFGRLCAFTRNCQLKKTCFCTFLMASHLPLTVGISTLISFLISSLISRGKGSNPFRVIHNWA